MTNEELLDALSRCPLCLDCLAGLSTALEPSAMLELFAAGSVESRVKTHARDAGALRA